MMTRRMVALVLVLSGCSLLNREGPNKSCADLDHGAKNACADGIIESCIEGAVQWTVCSSAATCEASWQTSDAYRCQEGDPPLMLHDESGGSPGDDGSGDPGTKSECTRGQNRPCVFGPPDLNGNVVAESQWCGSDGTWGACLGERFHCFERNSGGVPNSYEACSVKSLGTAIACEQCAGVIVCGSGLGETPCLTEDSFTPPVACGVPGTVVQAPHVTAGLVTYCLADGTLLDAAVDELAGPSGACGKTTADDAEPCAEPGTQEVCCDSTLPSFRVVRVCRSTGRWSACFGAAP